MKRRHLLPIYPKHDCILLTLLIIVILAISSCGSDGLVAGGGQSGTGYASGVVSEFGSIYVDGIHFDTSQAQVFVEGELVGTGDTVTHSNLSIGQVVQVKGDIAADGTGTAIQVYYDKILEGPVQSVANLDLYTQVITVLGQKVIADNLTIWGEATGEAISPGMILEVSGNVNQNGNLKATYITEKNDAAIYTVKGQVQNLDAVLTSFNINDLTIHYDAVSGTPPSLDNGDMVTVEGMLNPDLSLAANTLTPWDPFGTASIDTQYAVINGFVKNSVSVQDFYVDALPVTTDGRTRFEGITANDFDNGLCVEVSGNLINGRLYADTVRLNSSFAAVAGTVLSVDSGNDIITVTDSMLNTVVIRVSLETEFIGQTIDQLMIGQLIEVTGWLRPDSSISASQIIGAPQVVYVDGTVSTSGDGSTWATAVKTIQEAVDLAAGGDQIWVKLDDYQVSTPIVINKALEIYGGFDGTESNLSQRAYPDRIVNETNVYSTSGSPSRLFQISNALVIIDGLHFETGRAPQGAGVYLQGGSLVLRHCLFYLNQATDGGTGGGGIYASGSRLVINDVGFINNLSDGSGAAIYLDNSSANIDDAEIERNQASDGAVFYTVDSSLNLSATILVQNTANNADGAAIYTDNSMASIVDTTFDDNDCSGIKIAGGTVHIQNSIFFRNEGHDIGGAIEVQANSDVTVVNCTLLDQQSNLAAGAINGPAEVWNSILWDNLSFNGPKEISGDVMLYYSDVQQSGYAGSNGNIRQNPMLVNQGNRNFHLQSGSRCINAGSNSAPVLPTFDFDGDPRIMGVAVDIGADEY